MFNSIKKILQLKSAGINKLYLNQFASKYFDRKN